MRKTGARFRRNLQPINPMFALSTEASNELSKAERRAMDALLEHRATDSDMGALEVLVESSIRAIRISQTTPNPHLDPQALEAALRVFQRAGWSLRHAKQRHAQTGVYGLDAADRAALIEADQLVGEMRKPGVVLRKTWLRALKNSFTGNGIKLPALETLQGAHA